MAKVTRSVLKEIVKECLVEILAEGLNENLSLVTESKSKKQRPRNKNIVDPNTFVERNKMLREKTSREMKKVESITDDPMLQDILADTASTTLLEQASGESKGRKEYRPTDAASKIVHENSLDDLFDGSQNWAQLAFSGGKK